MSSARYALLWLMLALGSSSLALADTIDCSKSVTVQGKTFDLTKLKDEGPWRIESSVDTPPSTRKTVIQARLCEALQRNSDLSDSDQCPSGTRVCMTISNLKDGQDERITAVQPLAGEIGKGDFNPEWSLGTPLDQGKPEPLQVKMHGGMYGSREQSAVLVLACEPDQAEVKALNHAYSYSTATLSMSFSSNKFCATEANDGGGSAPDKSDPPKDTPSRSSRGGWGFFSWLFFLIFSAFAMYFAVGMWIRHSQYDARGWDMLPHRDFWADLPYVIKDLISSRRNSGGYAAI